MILEIFCTLLRINSKNRSINLKMVRVVFLISFFLKDFKSHLNAGDKSFWEPCFGFHILPIFKVAKLASLPIQPHRRRHQVQHSRESGGTKITSSRGRTQSQSLEVDAEVRFMKCYKKSSNKWWHSFPVCDVWSRRAPKNDKEGGVLDKRVTVCELCAWTSVQRSISNSLVKKKTK